MENSDKVLFYKILLKLMKYQIYELVREAQKIQFAQKELDQNLEIILTQENGILIKILININYLRIGSIIRIFRNRN